ncbi:hypothetical protein [Oleomonas cavernae]|nr:hypothetical protein [Oleomonas cavernae]
MPAPGQRERWEFMLAPGETREQMETDERIGELLRPWGDLGQMKIERRAVYRFHARCCDSFRKGLVFLAATRRTSRRLSGQGLVAGLARRRQPLLETRRRGAGQGLARDPRPVMTRSAARMRGP